MLIARFGPTWAASYEFSTLKAVDNWVASRLPVTQKVSGTGGEFDYYGEDAFPLAPITVTKTFVIKGTSYSNVETLLNTLRAATIAAGGAGFLDTGRTKLWGLWRDGSTRVWTWAKVLSMKAVETVAEKTSVLMTVSVTLRASLGVWYGETEGLDTVNPAVAGGAISTHLDCNNVGNWPALVNLTITPSADTMDEFDAQVVPSGGGSAISQWNYIGNVATSLSVDAPVYSCVVSPGVDAYTNLSPGETGIIVSADIPQQAWLWLLAGDMDILVEGTFLTSTGTALIVANWWDTYVL